MERQTDGQTVRAADRTSRWVLAAFGYVPPSPSLPIPFLPAACDAIVEPLICSNVVP